jgi:DNA modification methylase
MQKNLFDIDEVTIDSIISPQSYTGIYGFHKYWGKKPIESITYFIQNYTNEADIILDPFLGSGFICDESLKRNRRFIGIDINPFSIEHTTFLLNLPNHKEYSEAITNIKNKVITPINDSYRLNDKNIASHYLWENDKLIKIWLKNGNNRKRIENDPSEHDIELINSFNGYKLKYIRDITFFSNSRINSNSTMTIKDLFSNRALRNIELLIHEIKKYPENLQRALLLTLTSSCGQMSNMVFAITNRGKTKNIKSEKIEVGSWVIGFWRPSLHFEINVWNCFESKAKKLNNFLKYNDKKNQIIHTEIDNFFLNKNGCFLKNDNCLNMMKNIPDNSIKLICTDPPHGDRIPYLELSEIWNAILNKEVCFDDEIIVSNAKERNKNKEFYFHNMSFFVKECNRILRDDGVFILYFNGRDKESWKFTKILNETTDLELAGAFPMEYSAKSVVQENRNGGLKYDYILVMKHKYSNVVKSEYFYNIPGWSEELPVREMEMVYG